MRDGTEFYVWSTDRVIALLGGARKAGPAALREHSGFAHVYATDGSAIRNPGPTGWAWVNQRTGETGAGGLPHGINNIGELLALQYALEHAGTDGDLLVRSDSKYVINIATTWGRGWQRRGWKKCDGKTPENLAIVQTILALVDARTGRTEFEWVKGHAVDEFNELVDRLANEQARSAA